MFKQCVFLCVIAAAFAAPAPGAVVAPIAYSAPLVTAHSSQVISQNFHGVAAPLAAAPLVAAPYTAAFPYAHAPYTAALPYAHAPYTAAFPYAHSPLAAYAHAPAYYV